MVQHPFHQYSLALDLFCTTKKNEFKCSTYNKPSQLITHLFTYRLCKGPIDEAIAFKSSIDCPERDIDAKLLISDMEFFISLKSRCNARLFISDEDNDDDDDDRTCCKRCDELLATRDVVVLDFVVDDELLLFNIC